MAKSGHIEYRDKITIAGTDLAYKAVERCDGNLLSAKMALWKAVTLIEKGVVGVENLVKKGVKTNGKTKHKTKVRKRD